MLPEHVAVKMRQDLGSNDSEQFKKIYMSRHENVRYDDVKRFIIYFECCSNYRSIIHSKYLGKKNTQSNFLKF